jgi:hypothetical protein
MAYQPVQRNAGEIMYNAAMRRAQTLGGALENWSNTLYQRQQQQQALAQAKAEEDKAFNSKLKALEALLQSHKDKFKLDEAQLKQFLSTDPNESPKNRYGRIAGFVEGTMKAAELEKTQAEALKAKTPPPMEGRPMTMQEIEDLRKRGYDVNVVPTNDPNVGFVKGFSPRADPADMAPLVLNRNGVTTVVDPRNPTKILAEYPNISVGQGQMVVQQGAGAPAATAAPAAPPVSLPQFLPSGSMRPGATPSPQAQAAAQFAGPSRPAPVAAAPAPAAAAEAGLPRIVDLPGGVPAEAAKKEREKEILQYDREIKNARTALAQLGDIQTLLEKPVGKLEPEPTGRFPTVRQALSAKATDLAAKIKGVRDIIQFKELQELKASGTTLGQVAVRELESLSNLLGNLDPNQSGPQFKEQVNRVQAEFENTLRRLEALRSDLAEGKDEISERTSKLFSETQPVRKKIQPGGTPGMSNFAMPEADFSAFEGRVVEKAGKKYRIVNGFPQPID